MTSPVKLMIFHDVKATLMQAGTGGSLKQDWGFCDKVQRNPSSLAHLYVLTMYAN